jgi:hypothetical protein
MKKIFAICLLIALALPGAAYASFAQENSFFASSVSDWQKTFGGNPKAELLPTDLDNKTVNFDEVEKRPGSYTFGLTCARAEWALRSLATDPYFLNAFKGVQTITCQYGHYYKGDRDTDLNIGTSTIPGGNPSGKNESDADTKIVFLPATGDTITSIKIIGNWSNGAGGGWDDVIQKSLHARFPQKL